MTRILIPTYLRDIHATMIGAALRAKGHEAVLWHGADFPTRQSAAVHLSKKGVHWRVQGPDLDFSSAQPFDTVWLRRPVIEPVLPEDLHSGDRIICRRDCIAFSRGLWELVGTDAFWVNPRRQVQPANAKILQLERALAVGLEIPLTLCTNDPEEIRRFIEENEGEVIYKPFTGGQWTQGDWVGMLFTSNVSLNDLPDDDILRLSPGIFQRRIPKAYELRLTYMGEFCVAAKLLSQESANSELDWKGAFAKLKIEPTTIPSDLHRRCLALMKSLGIVFGCLDLIVTPEGETVFVEVNEMGQFLWLEEFNPEFRILEPFCEFLIQRRLDFSWQPSAGDLRFYDLYDEAIRRQEEVDALLHVAKPFAYTVPEGEPRTPALSESGEGGESAESQDDPTSMMSPVGFLRASGA